MEDQQQSAIQFTGSWKEFLPIALTNFLLIVVTLGIYRFWAKARERRYLWSRTKVIGDPLEWTGTGKEMFIGFIVVIIVLIPFYLVFQFALPWMAVRGMDKLAGLIGLIFWAGTLYLAGVGLFRALRYRLSRTYWRGIRGGSHDGGWFYGLKAMGYTGWSFLTLGFYYPWAKTKLWNLRWNRMSFGGLKFSARHNVEDLLTYWFILYLIPVVVIGMVAYKSDWFVGFSASLMTFFIISVVLIYVLVPLFFLAFWAQFYLLAAERTRLGELEFEFDVGFWPWFRLYAGNILLAVATLGFGVMFWTYRNWTFMARHLRIYGQVDVSALNQSETRVPGESEGLADAFDVGAF
ncbi:YjgN family protein [Sphingomicrobium flavum]|uniref:YjgN family protein n=1 Tax=Sphingomicrobium flavum TaxID=1229164 RepID=UPI0021ADA1CA|nr:YjgN family protein [Sphingomicrobium flavum]